MYRTIVSLVNSIGWSSFEIGTAWSWNISQTVFCDSGCNPKYIEFIPNLSQNPIQSSNLLTARLYVSSPPGAQKAPPRRGPWSPCFCVSLSIQSLWAATLLYTPGKFSWGWSSKGMLPPQLNTFGRYWDKGRLLQFGDYHRGEGGGKSTKSQFTGTHNWYFNQVVDDIIKTWYS